MTAEEERVRRGEPHTSHTKNHSTSRIFLGGAGIHKPRTGGTALTSKANAQEKRREGSNERREGELFFFFLSPIPHLHVHVLPPVRLSFGFIICPVFSAREP